MPGTEAAEMFAAFRRQAPFKPFSEVRIGHDVWIGAHATILAGVTIGDTTVIGAG